MLPGMTPTRHPSKPRLRSSGPVDAARIEAALLKVAALVAEDPAFAPVFERLEEELATAVKEETRLTDAQCRARTLLAQKAIRPTRSATCSSDAPLPYRSRSSR